MRMPLLFLPVALVLFVSPIRAAEAPATFEAGEFKFNRPADWQWVATTSPMRKAQLKVQSADKKESADVIFFYFGEAGGGGTKANIDRWLGQFEENRDKINSKVEEATVNGRKVTYVQAEGTYLSGMPGGPRLPQKNTMLFGAILESDKGNVFIRMTGPVALVKSAQPAFRKMTESALGKKEP
jgi:hypothetical protein